MKMYLAEIFSSGKESLLSLKDTLGSSNFSPLKPCEGLECLPQVLFLYVIFLLLCTGIFMHNKNKEHHHEKSHNNGQNSNVPKNSFQNNKSQNHVQKSKVENQKVPVAQGSQHKSAAVNA
ncbi:hypothetical protein PFMALIP_02662 [Plasmodium falciparum MaliPS096_E11]|uniref:Ring-exported protein 2 n=3 Tax=Plasmodium falciparum TaxID=5833 RepID=A0A024X7M3_PLAFC|nr:hypothetical protein PFMALIP_02662 [Plasmodium falciparum MaliPS096_E11]ETW61542.1 hypothetical protein PFMC_02633 [Plasmodium falciparum CAMP/Malaysia]